MHSFGGAGPPQNDRARRSWESTRPTSVDSNRPAYDVGNNRRQASRLSPEASRRAAAYLAPQQSARAVIRRWQPFRNAAGTVRGYLDVEFASGLVINSCKLMVGPAGKYWVATPAVLQRDADGHPLLDANNKPKWAAVVEFRDRESRDRFTDAVLAALERQHAEVLS